MTMQTELAIIGGGPAGLAAAIEAARRGVQVTLVDVADQPGGALALQTHAYAGTGLRGFAIGALLWRAAVDAGANLLSRTLAWGLFEDRSIGLAIDHGTPRERSELLGAEIVLVVTGGIDRPAVFPGATLPGVMTATAVLMMMHRWRVRPGNHVCIVGEEDPIAGLIVQYANDVEGFRNLWHLPSTAGVRALAGPDGTLASVEAWSGDTRTLAVPADTLILAEGMQPANELARMMDCAMAWSAPLGGHVPLHDAGMQTSVSGVYVAGDAAGIGDAGSAILQGRVAGATIADALGKKRRAFGAFPVTIAPGVFRPLDATVWRSVRMVEGAR